ncbi:MAG: AAA family ATPase [Victivallales bacterium]|nr:AAA family ATPase [Victivallales bacterium]
MIGRSSEARYLLEMVEKEDAQLVAVYGRRRVGKTYLVRQVLGKKMLFDHTGLYHVSLSEQLEAFRDSMLRCGARNVAVFKSWREAFNALAKFISSRKNGRRVVFLDELPWMDTQKSGFVAAFEHFWNGWASAQSHLLIIFCGSATSWIINKVLRNKGGLHNRVTGTIALQPFQLSECREYANKTGLAYTEQDICEAYMVFGGIPYYWSLLRKDESLAQSIDRLLFSMNGSLRHEFSELYASLFNHEENYSRLVSVLATRKSGMSLAEISTEAKQSKGGGLTKQLDELEQCGFIRRYVSWGKRKRDTLYQLMDNFTLFHLAFIADNPNPDPHFWSKSLQTAQVYAWRGLAFERVCLQHVEEIKHALGISGVLTRVFSWRHIADDVYPYGAQIDLIIERADRVVNLCEMKWTETPYAIEKNYYEQLQQKIAAFRTVTGYRHAIHFTLVSSCGLTPNKYSGIIQSEISLEQLFQ